MKKQAFRQLGAIGIVLAAQSAAAAAAPAAVIEGTWLTKSRTEMTISPCVDGYCGYITKIVVPDHIAAKYGNELKAIGTNFTDYNNKDPNLRNRPIQGLQILTLRPGADPSFYEGEIYNPEDGNVYSGSVQVTGTNSIRLKGCVLFVLCQEEEWTRISP